MENRLIDVIWPLLDKGISKEEIMANIHNVMDSWEPVRASDEDDEICPECGQSGTYCPDYQGPDRNDERHDFQKEGG